MLLEDFGNPDNAAAFLDNFGKDATLSDDTILRGLHFPQEKLTFTAEEANASLYDYFSVPTRLEVDDQRVTLGGVSYYMCQRVKEPTGWTRYLLNDVGNE